MTKRVRARFAPSPTGPLHMGGVRTALYCYLFTKKHNGDFILRIEDTDQTRYVPKAEQYIIDSLKWCGIEPDEGAGFADNGYGPYRQSERKAMYGQYAKQLVESGNAYYAFDTSEEITAFKENLKSQGNPSPKYDNVTRQYMKNSLTLSADEVKERLDRGDDYVIRYKMPRNEEVKFEDTIRGWVAFNTNQLDDKVLLKSDGMPTYHMANVVDDHLMEITHVIRGEEWLSSTPLHVLLYKSLEWDMPDFAHLPLILKPDGKGKLSKRDGDRLGFPVFPLNWVDPNTNEESIGYKERGFFPEAFMNMLAFLGWNPGTDQEIFSLEGLVEAFSLEKVGKSGAKFDFDKTKWFNQQYLKGEKDEVLASLVKPSIEEKGYKADDDYITAFCGMIKERSTFINDMVKEGYYFFEEVKAYDEKTIRKKWKQERTGLFNGLKDSLNNLSSFKADELEATVKTFMADNELGFGDVLPIIRVALTGTMKGPPVFEMMELFGKDMVINRLALAYSKFDEIALANA